MQACSGKYNLELSPPAALTLSTRYGNVRVADPVFPDKNEADGANP